MLRLFGAAGLFRATAGSASGAVAPPAHTRDVVMIIRHAEKPRGEEPPYGVTESGTVSAASLTVRGWMRAGALADAFVHPERWNVPVPAAIYASRPGDITGLRCMETVAPLAHRLGIDVDATYARGDEASLAAALLAGRGARLVAWEHLSIPAIVAGIGTVAPSPSPGWDGNRYDVIWCFVRDETGGWTFRAIPQQLLGGDAPTA